MITNQAYLFLIFILIGAIIGLLFDFFRILRKSFKTNDILTYIQDVIFWILTGIILLAAIFTFNNGEIRFFMFIGLFIGIIFYLILFSKYIIKICTYVINTLKKIIIKFYLILKIPIQFIYRLFNKVLFSPFRFVIINISSKLNKIQLNSTITNIKNKKIVKNK